MFLTKSYYDMIVFMVVPCQVSLPDGLRNSGLYVYFHAMPNFIIFVSYAYINRLSVVHYFAK